MSVRYGEFKRSRTLAFCMPFVDVACITHTMLVRLITQEANGYSATRGMVNLRSLASRNEKVHRCGRSHLRRCWRGWTWASRKTCSIWDQSDSYVDGLSTRMTSRMLRPKGCTFDGTGKRYQRRASSGGLVKTHMHSQHVGSHSARSHHFTSDGQSSPEELCSDLPRKALLLIVVGVPTIFDQWIPAARKQC